ncbi:MAG: hypothetical protein MI794_05965 [Pseudomonadales bacterium]|nr:hypothetical protein [Pseudomonadales bacterium]
MMDSEPGNRKGWHLDRGVSIAHILTTATIIFGALLYITDQDKRISNLELNFAHLKASRIEDQERAERKFDELKTDLRTINTKLDRLIEGR